MLSNNTNQRLFSWISLFITNFSGVLNDNLLKNLISFISIYWVSKSQAPLVITLATGVMVLPYILFSPLAGYLSKRYSKQKIIRRMKEIEFPIMLLAITGFYFENLFIVLFSMFLMGLQSTIYSPAKYGLIRDIGGYEGISFGTGTIEMLTFLGVLLGAFLAGILSDIKTNQQLIFISVTAMFVSLLGYSASLKLQVVESQPDAKTKTPFNPYLFVKKTFLWAQKEVKGLNNVVFGLSSFWLIGSLIQMNLLIYCPLQLHISHTETGLIMAFMAIAIAVGCWVAGFISGKKVKLDLIPWGGAGLSGFIFIIVFYQPEKYGFVGLILAAAFFAGLLKIPLNAWIQENVKGRKLSEAIAYNNLMNFIFIFISSILFGWINTFWGARVVFFIIALLSALLTIFLSIYLNVIHVRKNKLF